MSPIKFYKGLQKYFGITNNVNQYLCKTFLMTGKVRLDTIKFDKWLHNKHGNYEVDLNISMGQLIAKKYGISARVFVESYI